MTHSLKIPNSGMLRNDMTNLFYTNDQIMKRFQSMVRNYVT